MSGLLCKPEFLVTKTISSEFGESEQPSQVILKVAFVAVIFALTSNPGFPIRIAFFSKAVRQNLT